MSKFFRTLLQRSYLALIAIPFKLMPSLAYMAFNGQGSTAQLCRHIARQGAQRVLIVSDKILVELGIVGKAVEVLKEEGVECVIYDGILPDPTFAMVDEGLALQQQHNCDAVLAIGGGSSIDCAKTISSAATNGRDGRKLEGYFKVKAAPLPLFALPTTSGTGSEATIAAVISDPASHEKCFLADPKMLPKAVALDADLLLGMPAPITAATGMDALTHAVETYISLWGTESSNGYGFAAVKMIFDYLPRAYADGSDMEARANMMSAAAMGATAFQKGLGAIHAMSHPIGAHFNTHHGTTNAVCMPAVLEFNAPAIADRFNMAAAYLGIDGGFDGFCAFVQELNDSLGIPRGLSDLGVTEAAIPDLVKGAITDPSCGGNPIQLTEENLTELFKAAM